MKNSQIPTTGSYYGNSVSSQANARYVTVDNKTFYYSYRTLVAVKANGRLFIRTNDWGPTTGKHLNAISTNKSIRMSESKFYETIELI